MEMTTNIEWMHIGLNSLALIVGLLIAYRIVMVIFHRYVMRLPLFTSKRSKTYILMFTSVVRFLFLFIGVMGLLSIFGINIASIMASIGIVGIIIGFAIQDALKDIIKGIDIVLENYFQVGDLIQIDTLMGTVKHIGLKTTLIENMENNNLVSISNRNIQTVQVISNQLNIDIPMPYELSLKQAETIVSEIVDACFKMEEVHTSEYMGIQEYKDSYMNYRLKITCDIQTKFQTRRQIQRLTVKILEKHDIKIPYKKMEIISL